MRLGMRPSRTHYLARPLVCLALAVVVGGCGSYPVTDREEIIVARHIGVNGRETRVEVRVTKKGRQYLGAVDGPWRQTLFARAEYYLVGRGKPEHLAFLDADHPSHLWKYVGHVGDAWYALSPFYPAVRKK